MSWEFHVGQKVVCIDDTPGYLILPLDTSLGFYLVGRPIPLVKNQIYVIEKIVKMSDRPVGKVSPWFSRRFRPLIGDEEKKTNSAFTKLLHEMVTDPERPVGLPNKLDKRKVKEDA